MQQKPSNSHVPIMVQEVLAAFLPCLSPQVHYLDGTFGRGGHYQALLKKEPSLLCTAFDQDQEAISYGKNQFSTQVQQGQLVFYHDNFSQFRCYTQDSFDLILLDLGVSSPQLDQGERGFSFNFDGPLDMRMNQNQELTAKELINTLSEEGLIHVFKTYGEVRRPYRVVRAIVHDRKTKRYERTKELADLIARIDGWRIKGQHPATQYFMALRLAVNQELSVLETALPNLLMALNPGGRMGVITFHSLEDRIVKTIFKDFSQNKQFGTLINKKVITPTNEEQKQNPRSRSAKLRIFERSAQDEPPKIAPT